MEFTDAAACAWPPAERRTAAYRSCFRILMTRPNGKPPCTAATASPSYTSALRDPWELAAGIGPLLPAGMPNRPWNCLSAVGCGA
jgi:hypothetical protein